MMRDVALAVWNRCERSLDTPFGGALNPLRHLGAVTLLCFWLLALSGIYLYAVLDTSIDGAHRSIDELSRLRPYPGGLLRSLHRYAADALAVVVGLHLFREWLLGHYAGFRRYSWLTGVPALLFTCVAGIGGFWLNWDTLGQFSATATAELLDWLPLTSGLFTRNFLGDGAVTDRLFSLFVFVHLGTSLLLLFAAWFHLQRIAHAEALPPRALALGASAALLSLALLVPVMSGAAAELAVAPATITLDWFLLFVHPLTYATSAGFVWTLLAGTVLLLSALPFVSRAARPPAARVNPDHCNGCRQCFDDCPYAAITMQPHPDGRRGKGLAQVHADLCASCGICVGACPSSTPFRSGRELVTGIDLPQAPINTVRERLEAGLSGLRTERRIVVFGCDRGLQVGSLAGADVAALSLTCTGMLPPSFVEYALQHGATGVLVTGCRPGGCEFRLGDRWAEARLDGMREPHLRTSVPRARVRVAWAGHGDDESVRRALSALRDLPPAVPRASRRRQRSGGPR